MSRRSTPERTEAAWREASRARLMSSGMSGDTADAWIAAWLRQAAQDGLPPGGRYWDAGKDWIEAQRRERKRPG